MMERLILEDREGRLVRQIPMLTNEGHLIHRKDRRRMEVVSDLEAIDKSKIPYSNLAHIHKDKLREKPMALGEFGSLRLVDFIEDVAVDGELKKDSDRDWRVSLLASGVLLALMLSVVFFAPRESAKLTEELKQSVVRIVKTPPPPAIRETVIPKDTNFDATATKVPTKKMEMVKRAGALAVLGSLNSGKNRGGLNLGAASATAGAGLGGTGGSGGVQTSLYGKGIVSAPLGPGAHISGGGGYGTKGKGGGQEGYGSLSLVGSAGGMPVPLGAEAEIAKGLERSQIDEVIRRNLGQVRFCYEQGLQGTPALSGRVAMGFTIGGDGAVKFAQVESSSMGNKGVEDCISMRLKTWKFPVPQGGVDVKVTYPFNLRRSGQG